MKLTFGDVMILVIAGFGIGMATLSKQWDKVFLWSIVITRTLQIGFMRHHFE